MQRNSNLKLRPAGAFEIKSETTVPLSSILITSIKPSSPLPLNESVHGESVSGSTNNIEKRDSKHSVNIKGNPKHSKSSVLLALT